MLTATYSLVAITAEQDRTRSMLSRLQHSLHAAWQNLPTDKAFLETTLGKLLQFDKFLRSRKLELYLVPALRQHSSDAQGVVGELDDLSDKSRALLRSAGEYLSDVFGTSTIRISEIFHALDSYCETIAIRIQREERELIPLARRHFSIEDWFAVAAKLLAEGEGSSTTRRQAPRRAALVSRQVAAVAAAR